MKFFKGTVKVALSVILAVSIVLTAVSCGAGTVNNFKGQTLKELVPGDTVYIFQPEQADSISTDNKKCQTDDLILVTSLQGILAKNKAKIYIGKEDDPWISVLKKQYGLKTETINSMDDLFNKFKNELKNKKYVKFKYDAIHFNTQINQATTIASATGCLMAPVKNDKDDPIENFLTDLGFTVQEDLVKNPATLEDVFTKYQGRLSKSVIGVLDPQMTNSYSIRDYIIATGAGIYVTDVTETGYQDRINKVYKNYATLSIAIGNSYYQDMLQSAQNNNQKIMRGMEIFQWSHEACNAGVIPQVSQSISNLSLFASLKKAGEGQVITKNNSSNDSVHYVSVLANFGYDVGYWVDANDNAKKLMDTTNAEWPIGYTMNPMIYELLPQAYMKAIQSETENEIFIAAPNGFGMADLAALENSDRGNLLNTYLDKTNELLGLSGLGYMSMYGSIENNKDMIDKIAVMKNVQGGFILCDNFKAPGESGIYFSNGKVFAASREVLRDQSYKAKTQMANDSLAKILTRLTTYGKDKTKADGYTLLQVDDSFAATNSHAKLVSQLYKKVDQAKDKIKFVTPDQFLKLIKDNVNKNSDMKRAIGSINIAPTAQDVKATVQGGNSVQIVLLGGKNDTSIVTPEVPVTMGNPDKTLKFYVPSKTAHGTVSIQNDPKTNSFILNYIANDMPTGGTDSFQYTADDGVAQVSATVYITITPTGTE